MIPYRLKKTCRSRRVAGNHGELKKINENHVEFWGCIYLQVSWVPPLHLQANILPFTHAFAEPHCLCLIFKLLVRSSSRKAEKNIY